MTQEDTSTQVTDAVADTTTTSTSGADSLKGKLQAISDQLHGEFRGPAARARLDQFDSHLATLMMVVDHLYDEADRMTDSNYRNEEV